MPKKVKELTAVQVRRLTTPGLFAVGGVAGLHLQVKETGARSWTLRKVVGDKRIDFGLGGFPDVTLEQARDRAREYVDHIRRGVDPRAAKREAASALLRATIRATTFDEAARQCHVMRASEFRNEKHKNDWINSLNMYASPAIGSVPVADIEQAHVIKVLQPIWETKTETATRVRQRIESVLAWATVSKLRSGENPAAWKNNLEHLLPKPSKVAKTKHHAALPWREVGTFMASLRKAEGIGARALEFAILTAARSGEVRGATWSEIDLGAKLWTIPADRMKAEKEHVVPLSSAAIRVLRALPRLEGCDFVFPSPRGKMLSDMTLSAVTRRMKLDVVPHGFRSSFKDWARNETQFLDEVSELALAHVNSDATRAAYARDGLLAKRKSMMEAWATYCDTVQKGGKVVSLNRESVNAK